MTTEQTRQAARLSQIAPEYDPIVREILDQANVFQTISPATIEKLREVYARIRGVS